MSIYNIRSLDFTPSPEFQPADLPWEKAEEGLIACFPWASGSGDYRPDSRFYLLYNADWLFVLLLTQGADEKEPRTEMSGFQASVSKDSCLEFFLSFDPEEDFYLNFESNSAAVIHVGYGKDRHERMKPGKEEIGALLYRPLAGGACELSRRLGFDFDWGIMMQIPRSFLSRFWEGALEPFRPGQRLRGNFYKCGDLTAHEHYACWNEVKAPKPDYHRPECFGSLILE